MIPVPPAIQRIPWKLIAILAGITGFGLLVLYSAAGGNWSPWAWQQGVRFLVFLGVALVIGRFPLRIFEDFAYIGYIGILILLIAVELLGFVGGGSQRWLNLGFMNLQPSELMKVAIVIALARFYAQLPPGNTRTFTALWPALVMIGFPAALVMLLPFAWAPRRGTAGGWSVWRKLRQTVGVTVFALFAALVGYLGWLQPWAV